MTIEQKKMNLIANINKLRLMAEIHIQKLKKNNVSDFEIEKQIVNYQIKHLYLAENAMYKIEQNEPYLLN